MFWTIRGANAIIALAMLPTQSPLRRLLVLTRQSRLTTSMSLTQHRRKRSSKLETVLRPSKLFWFASILVISLVSVLGQATSILAPNAIQVIAGDFNGDGKPDLLIQTADTITVLPGKGDGTFANPIISQNGLFCFESPLAVADVNQDGKLDLICLSANTAHSNIALGNGDGTFRTGVTQLLVAPGNIAAIADFNGDGKPDLVVNYNHTNAEFGGYGIYFGNGDGTFTAGAILGGPSGPNTCGIVVLVGDVNHDGKADIVGECSVFLGNGDGTFRGLGFRFLTSPAAGGAIADLNGDGNPDIIYTEVGGQVVAVSVFLGNGDGTFHLADYVLTPGSEQVEGEVSNPLVADFNQDGAPDVAFASNLFPGIAILTNNGDGTVSPYGTGSPGLTLSGVPAVAIPSSGFSPITLADFNGDGKPDIAVIDHSTATGTPTAVTELTVLLNTTPLAFPILLGGIVNAASGSHSPLAPGSLASAYTVQQPYQLQEANILPLPTALQGASLLLNSIAVPLLAIGPQQINFQVPWELAGMSSATIAEANRVGSVGTAGKQHLVMLATFSPGIFTINGRGSGQGAITIANSSTIAAPVGAFAGSRPAAIGEYITIYCNGLGPVSNRPVSGAPASGRLSITTSTPSVTIGGIAATVQFSGLAPGFVGVNQVNVQIPPNAPAGRSVPLVIRTSDGSLSNSVNLAVQ